MPYIEGRTVHDADAHIMETPELLETYVESRYRDAVRRFDVFSAIPDYEERFADVRRRHDDPAWRADDASQILLRKNWAATGSFLKEDRPRALDLLGFESQLVFNTFVNGKLLIAERGDDVDFAYGFARAHNRSMQDFCGVDPRLLGTGYVPLRDFGREEELADGCVRFLDAHETHPCRVQTGRAAGVVLVERRQRYRRLVRERSAGEDGVAGSAVPIQAVVTERDRRRAWARRGAGAEVSQRRHEGERGRARSRSVAQAAG